MNSGFEDEWEIKRLGHAGRCLRGVNYNPDRDLFTHDTDRTIRLLRANNVQGTVVVTSDIQYVSTTRVSPDQILRKHDIVICLANGSKRLVGKAGLFAIDDGYDYTFGAFMGCFRTDVAISDPDFVFSLFQTGRYRDYINNLLVGSSINNLRPSSIESLEFLFPRLPEQTTIGKTLSDVDALLDRLDQLITKKRNLKQVAMQQLLTGQARLPGFRGEWETTTFDNVVRHHSGNSNLIKGKLQSSPVTGFYPGYSASGQDVWCDHYEHEGDAIVVSAVGSRCGKAFSASGRWCAIANTHVVWPNESKVNLRFLDFFINDENFWLKSGSGQPFVLFKQTFARTVRLPPPPEQVAIATVLAGLDAELNALDARRKKTHDLKHAMMQELLTGKTRLVC